jgi:MmgE/PrpD N-terminal domain
LFPFHLPDLIVVFKAWHDSLADRRIPKGKSTMAQFARQPISDPHAEEKRTAVQRIAAFAKAAHAKDLKPHIRQLYKRNILDSLGCAIAALPGCPFQSLRARFEEFRSPGRCTLIGGGKTSLDQAAFFNPLSSATLICSTATCRRAACATRATTLEQCLPLPNKSPPPGNNSYWHLRFRTRSNAGSRLPFR